MSKAKWLIASLVLAFAPSVAMGQINLPTDHEGHALPPPDAPCVAHNFLGGVSATEGVVTTSGPAYVAWVAVSTAATNGLNYVILIDSSVVDSGVTPVARLFATSSETAIYQFRPPIRFANGITVDASQNGLWGTVCYRRYNYPSP